MKMLTLALLLLPALVSAFNYGGKNGTDPMRFGDRFTIQETGIQGRFVQAIISSRTAFMLGGDSTEATVFTACRFDGNDCSQFVGEVVGQTVMLTYQQAGATFWVIADKSLSPLCSGGRVWISNSKDVAKQSLFGFSDVPGRVGYVWVATRDTGPVNVNMCTDLGGNSYLIYGGSASASEVDFILNKVQ